MDGCMGEVLSENVGSESVLNLSSPSEIAF